MEWTKAKNYTILFLIILNIILLGLNTYKSLETRLSSGRINGLSSLLEQRNITLACPLPRSYKPMAEISVSDYNFNFLSLEKIFMSGDNNVQRTEENNSIIFISDRSRLIVKDSTINYTTTSVQPITSEKQAKEYTDRLISEINKDFGKYRYHSTLGTENGYLIKYYEKAEGLNVFSNFAYFTIKNENISLALNYVKIGNELREKSNIYAADEAIYAASPLIENENKRQIISKTELGYYCLDSENGYESYAVPFYVIISDNREYFVNGYTGECF